MVTDVAHSSTFSQEIGFALADLARLGLRAACGPRDGVAEDVLDRTLRACGAPRGALISRHHAARAVAHEHGTKPQVLAARDIATDSAVVIAEMLDISHDAYVIHEGYSWAQVALLGEVSGRQLNLPAISLVYGWPESEHSRHLLAVAEHQAAIVADAAGAALATMLVADAAAVSSADDPVSALESHAQSSAAMDWESTFDAISDPVCIMTPDYRVVRTNRAYRDAVDTDVQHCVTNACFERAHDRLTPCDDCPLPRSLVSLRPEFTLREQHRRPDPLGPEERRIYQVWTYPIRDASGSVNRVVEIMKDVTEQERLRELAAESEALRVANHVRSELLGTVSHELRSPLTSIKGYAATLRRHDRRLPREERREFLAAIEAASDKLAIIIDRLLQMSELDMGTITMSRHPVDIVTLVRRSVAKAARESRGRHTFSLRILDATGAPTNSPPLVTADERRLSEVIDNLLENAVKYSPDGGAIELMIRHVKSRPDRPESAAAALRHESYCQPPYLELRVRDGGIGIPGVHLSQVFDTFHRVDTRLTREVDGLGLGLAICKRIVEMHGGTISAQSESGKGSTFTICLPLPASPELDAE